MFQVLLGAPDCGLMEDGRDTQGKEREIVPIRKMVQGGNCVIKSKTVVRVPQTLVNIK